MNESALAKVKKKRKSCQRYMETKEGRGYLKNAKAGNQTKLACRNAVKEFEQTIAKETKKNPKAFYTYARSKSTTREGIADLKDPSGGIASSDREKARVLNDLSCSSFTKEDTENIPQFDSTDYNQILYHIEITEEPVIKALQNLNPCTEIPRTWRSASICTERTISSNSKTPDNYIPEIP